MTLYVVAAVPAALAPVAEAAVAPLLLGVGSIFTVPLSADGTDPPTYYGCCAPIPAGGEMASALPALASALPGTLYHTVAAAEYDHAAEWAGTLAGWGLTRIDPERQ